MLRERPDEIDDPVDCVALRAERLEQHIPAWHTFGRERHSDQLRKLVGVRRYGDFGRAVERPGGRFVRNVEKDNRNTRAPA